MDSNLYGIIFAKESHIYLPEKQITTWFEFLGKAKGYELKFFLPDVAEVKLPTYLEDFTFSHLKINQGQEVLIGFSAPGFSAGSSLLAKLKNDSADNQILLFNEKDGVDLYQIYDVYPRTPQNKNFCSYGDLISKMRQLCSPSHAVKSF